MMTLEDENSLLRRIADTLSVAPAIHDENSLLLRMAQIRADADTLSVAPAHAGVDEALPESDKSICWTAPLAPKSDWEGTVKLPPPPPPPVSPPWVPIPERTNLVIEPKTRAATSDGSSADYYKLPADAAQVQDLISYRNMNSQIGEIFRACYRYGQDHHSPRLRDINKIIFYAQAERDRLLKYGGAK